MQRAGLVLIAVLAMAIALGAAALCAVVRADSASVLLQEGVYEQDVAGNVDRAMEVYQQIIKDAASDRRYVAEAHFRLGKCYLNKGERDKAQEEFQQVVEGYADQAGLATAARTELAKLAPPAPAMGTPTLGPVVELTVNDDNAGKDMFVDLDTGRLVTPPAGLDFEDENAVLRWIRSSGVDALAETSVSIQGLVGFDMVVQPVASELWDGMTAKTILTREWLAGGTGGAPAPMPGKGALPVTYMFKTREGGMGILQIVGFAENPRGVKIRYRMVQRMPPATPMFADGARLAELRIRLADSQAELKTKEAGLTVAKDALETAKRAADAGRLDSASMGRMQADYVRVSAEFDAARQKVDILIKEIARLEAGSAQGTGQGAEGVSPAAQLADLRIRLADSQAELKTKEAGLTVAKDAFETAKRAADAGRLDTVSLGRAQADLVKASAEYDAAHQKVEILTQEIARLEGTLRRPEPAALRRATLRPPEKSGAGLDLASGELVPLPPNRSDKEDVEALENLGKGDVIYAGNFGGKLTLAFIRGASPDAPDGSMTHLPGRPLPMKTVSGPWPVTFTVRAANGTPYAVTVLRADEQSCELEYGPLPGAPQPPAAPPGGKP